MRINPQTEEEIQQARLFPKGKYVAILIDAQDKDLYGKPLLTRNGEEKIVLNFNVFNKENNSIRIIATLCESFKKILKHAYDALDLQDKYNTGDLHASDFVSRINSKVILELGTRTYTKDSGETITVNNLLDILKYNDEKKDDFHDDELPW
ncbi:MAG: hypothetical protein ACYC6W_10965 [Nitrosotalea sp.]